MANLEHSLFVPADLMQVSDGELKLRFPVGEIAAPSVRGLWLHVRLQGHPEPTQLHIREFASMWESVGQEPPRRAAIACVAVCEPYQRDVALLMDGYIDRWLFGRKHFGLGIVRVRGGAGFDTSQAPLLEVVMEPERAGVSGS